MKDRTSRNCKMKFLLIPIIVFLSISAHAANNWTKIIYESDTETRYLDENSLKMKTDKALNRGYIEARVLTVSKTPKVIEKSKKFYTHFYRTFAIDCYGNSYKIFDMKFVINNKIVESNASSNASWNKLGKYSGDVALAAAACDYYQSFLGS